MAISLVTDVREGCMYVCMYGCIEEEKVRRSGFEMI